MPSIRRSSLRALTSLSNLDKKSLCNFNEITSLNHLMLII